MRALGRIGRTPYGVGLVLVDGGGVVGFDGEVERGSDDRGSDDRGSDDRG